MPGDGELQRQRPGGVTGKGDDDDDDEVGSGQERLMGR